MKTLNRRRLGIIAVFATLLVSLVAAGACSGGNDEAVDLLKDPKIGLNHLNAELHTVKGEDLLSSPKFGLAHLNDEFHGIKGTLADPKSGLVHINDELHTLKQQISDLSQQVASSH